MLHSSWYLVSNLHYLKYKLLSSQNMESCCLHEPTILFSFSLHEFSLTGTGSSGMALVGFLVQFPCMLSSHTGPSIPHTVPMPQPYWLLSYWSSHTVPLAPILPLSYSYSPHPYCPHSNCPLPYCLLQYCSLQNPSMHANTLCVYVCVCVFVCVRLMCSLMLHSHSGPSLLLWLNHFNSW